ncbi:alpha/beta hydrolase [Actinomadura graeca]|uniref:Alpha/beta hydrolase n=2 Tax=Actinomadura graeca TaxID=2750812 RepID=A0ABX8R6D6_9ACTN|nr:alpha/beta hydrolase [Actinomadura graeca]
MEPDAPHCPDPPVVVFVHGLVMDNLSSFYYTIAGPVAAGGARCVLYDQRGHGRSERPPTGYGPGDAVADLFAVLDALGRRAPVVLVAHSWGGVTALKATLAHPSRVAGLVMIEGDGPSERPGWTEDILNTLELYALALDHDRLPERLLDFGWRRESRTAAGDDALVNGTSLVADIAGAAPVRPADLAAVACPVLAVYGRHSELLDAGRLLARAVPRCTLHVMEGHAHTVLREGTAGLLEVLSPWLARHAHAGAPVTEGARAMGGAV